MSNRELIVPANVALIPDGNRRWAKNNRINLFNGYNYGIKKFIEFSIWLKSMGSKSLTVWALSTENINKRTPSELGILYKLYTHAARDKKIIKMLDDTQARVRIIGNRELIPKTVDKALRYVEKHTEKYNKFYINILLAYGGHEDIVYAAKRLLASGVSPKEISEDKLKGSLRTALVNDPDLIIRTSGEERLSGLLPWQSSYSELYFSKKYWPDFSKSDLNAAIREFSRRKRRYGK
ncbi:MAG: polyprenyl diphosphate synthase [Candidatus Marsarchaeota archaeon]|jgi:tritrans,polycis-undecaprenyl-diphosphate synthase [geranylgeranyl-diphosphate specific]|nr:polyprenyl diphosphate synthase [Candidatus Marsarchaeota archaeon]